MSVDYNEISKKYDSVRGENMGTINMFLKEMPLNGESKILDFGCGTGNFTNAIKLMTDAHVYGVEPSQGMREKAIEKNAEIVFVEGNHENIPFENDFFDFIYMTDVIHHVPDVKMMFRELYRVLKPTGKLCIVTESHKQINARFWTRYFPTTAFVEIKRYPDIDNIVEKSLQAGFTHLKNIITDKEATHTISERFTKLVENKGYTMFELIEDTDYQTGLKLLKVDYEKQEIIKSNHGETFIWLQK